MEVHQANISLLNHANVLLRLVPPPVVSFLPAVPEEGWAALSMGGERGEEIHVHETHTGMHAQPF